MPELSITELKLQMIEELEQALKDGEITKEEFESAKEDIHSF